MIQKINEPGVGLMKVHVKTDHFWIKFCSDLNLAYLTILAYTILVRILFVLPSIPAVPYNFMRLFLYLYA